jgi:SepF-like predicted cell division protein (DUF552 family)
MAGFFSKLKDKMNTKHDEYEIIDEAQDTGYVELGAEKGSERSKVVVRPFVIENFEHIKPILDCLREGNTICLVNIKPLKDKDIVELKRAINKLKKTCDAIEGDIAGFGEDWIAIVPTFAHIHRGNKPEETQAPKDNVKPVTEYSDQV